MPTTNIIIPKIKNKYFISKIFNKILDNIGPITQDNGDTNLQKLIKSIFDASKFLYKYTSL